MAVHLYVKISCFDVIVQDLANFDYQIKRTSYTLITKA